MVELTTAHVLAIVNGCLDRQLMQDYGFVLFCFVLFSKDTFNTAFSSMSITGVKSSPRLTKTCFPKSPTQCAMKILMLHNYLKLGTKGFLKQVKMIEKYFIPKWLMNTSE